MFHTELKLHLIYSGFGSSINKSIQLLRGIWKFNALVQKYTDWREKQQWESNALVSSHSSALQRRLHWKFLSLSLVWHYIQFQSANPHRMWGYIYLMSRTDVPWSKPPENMKRKEQSWVPYYRNISFLRPGKTFKWFKPYIQKGFHALRM